MCVFLSRRQGREALAELAPPAVCRSTTRTRTGVTTRKTKRYARDRSAETTRNMKGRRTCISQTRTCGPLSHVSFMKPLPLALLAGRGPGPVVRNDWCGRPTTCAHTCRADRAGAPYARDRLAAPHASAPSLSPSSSASSHRSSSIASLISSISAASLPLSSTRSYSEARRHPGRVKDAPARSHAREVASAPRAAAPPRG